GMAAAEAVAGQALHPGVAPVRCAPARKIRVDDAFFQGLGQDGVWRVRLEEVIPEALGGKGAGHALILPCAARGAAYRRRGAWLVGAAGSPWARARACHLAARSRAKGLRALEAQAADARAQAALAAAALPGEARASSTICW